VKILKEFKKLIYENKQAELGEETCIEAYRIVTGRVDNRFR